MTVTTADVLRRAMERDAIAALHADIAKRREAAAVKRIATIGYGPWQAEPIVYEYVSCRCHEVYWRRGMVDPQCPWHQGGEDIVPALLEAGLLS